MKLKNLIITLSVLVATLVASSGTVHASGAAWAYKNGGGQMPNRACASVNCPVVRWINSGTKVFVICWLDTQYAVGNYGSVRWFRTIAPINGGYDGWMHSSYIYYQPVLPRC